MKSKAPLALMEQLMMVLVFALAAALCVQVFVLSDRASRRYEARDQAVLAAQNAAETLKSGRGDMGRRLSDAADRLGGDCAQGLLWVDYDENWQPGGGTYRLTAQGTDSGVSGLAMAHVAVEWDGGELFSLDVAWQEVDGDA
ncbi:hypothetical protein [uncultured Dysosmobacter sp.]|uniref:hypothetical protein n=1 Tax=uncultured Dysosmobacter sp. TaxID=2591384 RepID=UPI0026333B7D|nr:hypothetical protein [uncultured Dysosmobacter sp.]